MKYEWNVDELCIFNIVNNIYNINDQKDFVHFCFKKQVNYDSFVSTKSKFSKILLEEIQKPEREHWLKYAIDNGYVKPVKQTFIIGDVIEFKYTNGYRKKVIINSTDFRYICLNTMFGARLDEPFIVKDEWEIKLSELKNTNKSLYEVKYVGHGAEYLI